jgi:RimJ/RimL family protein N-acetyltransferase
MLQKSFVRMLRLDGEKIYLQEFAPENLADGRYHAWLRDLDVVRGIYRLEYLMPIQYSEIEEYANNLMQSETDCFFAIYAKATDDFIGTLRIGHIDWRVGRGDIGILIGDKNYWGRGIATDAVNVACRYAFKELSLRRLTGGTISTNEAMCRCFERAGFKQEGRLREHLLVGGVLVDHVLFGLLKDEFIKRDDQGES